MITVKELTTDQAKKLSPQIKQFTEKLSNLKIYLREIDTCVIEDDTTYYLINSKVTPITIPKELTGATWRDPKYVKELNIPKDSHVIGVRFNKGCTTLSLALRGIPAMFPVFNKVGFYKTRSGVEVMVDKINPTVTLSMSGHIPVKGKKIPQWNHWTKLGECNGDVVRNDLVEFVRDLPEQTQ